MTLSRRRCLIATHQLKASWFNAQGEARLRYYGVTLRRSLSSMLKLQPRPKSGFFSNYLRVSISPCLTLCALHAARWSRCFSQIISRSSIQRRELKEKPSAMMLCFRVCKGHNGLRATWSTTHWAFENHTPQRRNYPKSAPKLGWHCYLLQT